MVINMDRKMAVICVLVAALVLLAGYVVVDKFESSAYANGFDSGFNDGVGYIFNTQITEFNTHGVVTIPVNENEILVLDLWKPPEE